MKLDIGLDDIHHIPIELRNKGISWQVWWPEEPFGDKLVEERNQDWFLEENYTIHFNSEWPTYWLFKTESFNQQFTPNKNPAQHFLILNRKPRMHRLKIMQGLEEQGLLENNSYSWLDSHSEWFRKSAGKFKTSTVDDMQVEEDMWKAPLAYQQTAISLVTETYEEMPFITEKCFIPIHNCRMFLPFGGAGTIDKLKSWGFDFPPFFDLQYDQHDTPHNRIGRYIKSVEQLVNAYTPKELYKLCQPYAEHNKQAFDKAVLEHLDVPSFTQIPKWAEQLIFFTEVLDK
jgi:hypothetical protein